MNPADTDRTDLEGNLRDISRGMRRERDPWKKLAHEHAVAAERYARENAQLRSDLRAAEAERDLLRTRVEEMENALAALKERGGGSAA